MADSLEIQLLACKLRRVTAAVSGCAYLGDTVRWRNTFKSEGRTEIPSHSFDSRTEQFTLRKPGCRSQEHRAFSLSRLLQALGHLKHYHRGLSRKQQSRGSGVHLGLLRITSSNADQLPRERQRCSRTDPPTGGELQAPDASERADFFLL